MKSLVDLLHSYVDAYRELVNSKTWPPQASLKKTLRLTKEEDWEFICTAMDIVSDACLAIESFLRFGLDGPTRYDDTGEKYLRLYGVLNATYIQQQAIHNLFKLNNVPNPKKAKEKIGSLRIREVRHKLGAHSNDYFNLAKNKTESYVLTRFTLGRFNCDFLNNENLEQERVDLKSDIEEHLKLMIELLDETYEKAITIFYRDAGKRKNGFLEKLKDLRIERDGGMVQVMPDGQKIIITMTNGINITKPCTGLPIKLASSDSHVMQKRPE